MKHEFKRFIQKESLFAKNEPILLAVSGGVDSVVMTHLFADSGYTFAVAHVNFQLRGSEADEDARWVASLAQHHEVPYFIQTFDTKNYALKHGLSTQMAARQLRYEWLKKLRAEQQYAYVAVAHHLDDQLETTLLNLCQGTGVAGLRGMLPKRDKLIRPLLFATRAQVTAYAQTHQLNWREDRSNASTAYRRNFLRHEVLPRLEEINPNLLATYQRTQERLLATEQLLNDEVQRVRQKTEHRVGDEVRWDKALLIEHAQLPLMLSELLRPFGFSYPQACDIAQRLRGEATPGKLFYAGRYQLLIDRQHLIASVAAKEGPAPIQIEVNDQKVKLPRMQLSIQRCAAHQHQLVRSATVAALDADRLRFPLQLRPWRAGDWFCPLGMHHRKKLSDFLIDQKVPLHQKSRMLVLLSGKNIVWVVGYRIDHRFRITEQTERVYEIMVTTVE